MRLDKGAAGRAAPSLRTSKPKRLEELDTSEEIRFSTGYF
jgi:hypothetical protein